MAQTFKNAVLNNITGSTTVYTVPVATTAVIVGLVISNDSTTSADTTVTVAVTQGAQTVNLIKGGPLPYTSNISVLNNNTRMVMVAGDVLSVTSGQPADVIVSILEIT